MGNQQQDIRHKLKTIEWGKILEKPLQIWKTQTEPYKYDMHFKVQVQYLKEVNVYKNPILDEKEEIVSYEKIDNPNDEDGRVIHESYTYEEEKKFFEKTIKNIETDIYKYTTKINDDGSTTEIPRRRIIPNDTYLLEIFTWDDYRFLKGYPENDYSVKEDNVLQYKYNETFLDISLEEISFHKYLTFRVHKDKIKQILIRKNDKPIYRQSFINDKIDTFPNLSESSYIYFDDSVTNENTYGQGEYDAYYDIEDNEANFGKIYFADIEKDEYVFRLPLGDDDFNDDGIIKDTYDLEVTTFENRYKCLHEYDKVYTKRYCGYDNVLGDCFDHDYSLDIIGALLNVPRFRFYQIYRKNTYYLSRTYPSFYNRATEDDYHYMKRIQYYISNYNHIVFPVLEFWKWYHTDSTIRSRRRIVGEMDYSYFRTNSIGCDDEYDSVDEEFDVESIAEYSINKATNINGESKQIHQGESVWYESIIVDNLYVVPTADYRFRYGLKDNEEDVTIRLICYNRDNVEIRTSYVEPKEHTDPTDNYNVSDDFEYTDTYVTIPNDAVSIKIILESNSSFSFADASFERKTLVNFDTSYITTETDYNSNVYELYADYYSIPSNIRIGGSERFGILFKRSLPLTKSGFFYVDLEEDAQTNIITSTNTSLTLSNILTDDCFEEFDTYSRIIVNNFIIGECTYELEYEMVSIDEIDLEDMTDNDYFECIVTSCQGNEQLETETFEKVYSDTTTYLKHIFTVPYGTDNLIIEFSENGTVRKESIKLSRVEEIRKEEII